MTMHDVHDVVLIAVSCGIGYIVHALFGKPAREEHRLSTELLRRLRAANKEIARLKRASAPVAPIKLRAVERIEHGPYHQPEDGEERIESE